MSEEEEEEEEEAEKKVLEEEKEKEKKKKKKRKHEEALGGEEEEDSLLQFFLCAHHGQLNQIEALLQEGKVEVNARDRLGWTALHHAAFQGNTDVAKFLLECGALVDATNKEGYTPLHWAAVNGYEETVKLLLEYKGNANLKDIYGRTAADLSPLKLKKKMKDHKRVKEGWMKQLITLSRTPVARALLSFVIQVLLCMLLEFFHQHFTRYYQLGVVLVFQLLNPFIQMFSWLLSPLLHLVTPLYTLFIPLFSSIAQIVSTRLNILAKLIMDLFSPFQYVFVKLFWAPVKWILGHFYSIFLQPLVEVFQPFWQRLYQPFVTIFLQAWNKALVILRDTLVLKKIVQWMFTPLIAAMKWLLQFLPSDLVLPIHVLSFKLLGKRNAKYEVLAAEDAALVVIFCFTFANYIMVFASGYLWKMLMLVFGSTNAWTWAPNFEHHIYGINFLVLFLASAIISRGLLFIMSKGFKLWNKRMKKRKVH